MKFSSIIICTITCATLICISGCKKRSRPEFTNDGEVQRQTDSKPKFNFNKLKLTNLKFGRRRAPKDISYSNLTDKQRAKQKKILKKEGAVLEKKMHRELARLEKWQRRVEKNREKEKAVFTRMQNEINTLKGQIAAHKQKVQKFNNSLSKATGETTPKTTYIASAKSATENLTIKARKPTEINSTSTRSRYNPKTNITTKTTTNPELTKTYEPAKNTATPNNNVAAPPVAGGVTAPPFSSTPSNPRTTAPAENSRRSRYTKSGPPAPKNKIKVKATPGAQTGRVLWIEHLVDKKVLRLDIGSKAGLSDGSLISVGGIGSGHSIWKIVSCKRYSARAEKIKNSPAGGATQGDRVYQVKIIK